MRADGKTVSRGTRKRKAEVGRLLLLTPLLLLRCCSCIDLGGGCGGGEVVVMDVSYFFNHIRRQIDGSVANAAGDGG